MQFGQEHFQFAIANQRVATHNGEMKGPALFDYFQDAADQGVALVVGEVA